MLLERVLFESTVFDPMTKGAENKKSFYTSKDYSIELDPQNGFVQVSAMGHSVCVPFCRVKEFRLHTKETAVVSAVKTKAVQVAEGTFSIQPATLPAFEEPPPAPAAVASKSTARRRAAQGASPVM